MLVDFAAELKCVTQRQIVQAGVTIVQLPSNLHQLIASFTAQAQSIIAAIHAEISDIRSRKRQRQIRAQQLSKTRQQLEKATKLIQQGNEVITQVQPITGSESDEDAAAEPPGSKADELAEQIRILKDQMSLLAALKRNQTPESANAIAQQQEEEEEEFDASPVPMAPPMLSEARKFPPPHRELSLSSFASIPIASPMFSADVSQFAAIPIAPPMTEAICDVPTAPPMSPDSKIPSAPPMRFSVSVELAAPSTPSRSILAELSENIRATPAKSAMNGKTRPSTLAPVTNASIYTRSIPGSDSLSHTDLIKVAAKISLRRTEVPRSPGGTPARKANQSATAGLDQAMLAHALIAKFKNANRRASNAAADKENWNTD